MTASLTDNEIISRVLAGERELYSELVKRYQNFVFTVSLKYTPVREDAEEIAQDVFVKAFRYLGDFRGDSKFSTWLYSIVNSTSITFLRKKKLETSPWMMNECLKLQTTGQPKDSSHQRNKNQSWRW